MSTATYIFGIVAALLALVVIVELLRRRRLRERHAIWWLVAGVAALVIGIFPTLLTWASEALGVGVPANLAFFVSIAVLGLVSIQHSSELTRLENKTRTLAEAVALLEARLAEAKSAEEPGEPPTHD